MWLVEQADPRGARYNVLVAFDIAGVLDTTRLVDAIRSACAVHPALHTPVLEHDGRLVQVFQPPRPIEVEVVDVDDDSLDRLIFERGRATFHMAEPPLARAHVFRLSGDRSVMLLVVHHSAVDGVAVDRVVSDIQAAYNRDQRRASTASRESAGVYSQWRDTYAQSPRHEADVVFWRERLVERPVLFEDLPAMGEPEARRGTSARSTAVPLAAEAWSTASDSARALGCTEHMLLMAATAAALSRCAQADELLIGFPYSEREDSGLGDAVGFYVNTLPCRLRVDRQEALSRTLLDARDAILQTIAHGSLPYDAIVELAPSAHRAGGDPLLDVFVGIEPAPLAPDLHGVVVSHRPLANPNPAKFPIAVLATQGSTGIHIAVESDDAILDGTAAGSFAQALARFIEAFAVDTRRTVGGVELGVPLVENGAENGISDARSVLDLVLPAISAAGEDIAVQCNAETLTYRELDSVSERIAHHIKAAGARTGDIVGICVQRGVHLPAAILGILRSGCAYLPLDPAYPTERIDSILNIATPSAVIVDRETAGQVRGQKLIGLDDAVQTPVAASRDDRLVAADDPAYVLFTSGSTGEPKGVEMLHGALVNLLSWQLDRSHCGPRDTTLSFASATFDVCFQELFATFCSGGRLVVAEDEQRQDPALLAALIAEQGVNRIFMPFVALEAVLREATAIEARSLREVITAGEQLRMSPAVREAQETLGFTLDNQYGPTETHVVTAHLIAPGDAVEELPVIGGPIAGTSVDILDAQLTQVPFGWPGEICVRGRALARGYLRRPDLTAARFVSRDGDGARLYRTGDRARHRADGALEFLGRTDHQVKISGYRIELGEVEHAILRTPEVAQAVVVAVEGSGSRYLAAFLVPAEGRAEGDAERAVRAELTRSLPPYMSPQRYFTLTHLPRTVSGKVDRRGLVDAALESAAADRGQPDGAGPRTPVEEAVWKIFAEVLPVAPSDLSQEWLELGGHSLLVARIAAEIRKQFHVDLRVADLFKHQSVHDISAYVETLPQELAAVKRATAAGVAASATSEFALTFNQEASLRKRYDEARNVLASAFNLPPFVFRSDQPLDPDRLAWAMAALADRHDALRTRFEWNGGKPRQLFGGSTSVRIDHLKLSSIAELDTAEALFRREVDTAAETPFTPGSPHRLRAVLAVMPDESSRVAFVFDHLVCDQLAARRCLEDLATLYTAGSIQDADLPVIEPTLSDYLLWEREFAVSEEAQRQLTWWSRNLDHSHLNPVLSIASWPAGSGMAPVIRVYSDPSSATAHKCRQAALSRRSTPYAVFVSALQEVIAREFGQAPAVSSPFANREDPRWADAVANLSHRIVVPPTSASPLGTAERLSQVTEWMAQAREYLSLPFPYIQAKLAPELYGKFRTRPWLSVDVYEAQDRMRCGAVILEPVRITENMTDRQSLTATLVLGEGPHDGLVELAFPEGALSEEGARSLLELVDQEIALLAETPGSA